MQLLPRLRTLVLAAVLTTAMLGPRLGASTEDSVSHAAGATQNGATLTILAAPVEIARSGLDEFTAPSQGELLQVGDIVRTGPGGLGLITFFDGSESQLGPDSQLQIERLDAIPDIHIALLQTAGVTTNHVVPVRPGGSFQTDTPAAVAMVRGTSYAVAVTGLRMIRPSANPQQATAQVTSVPSADGVAQSVDPAPASDPDASITDAAQADAAAGTDVAKAADMANGPDVPVASDMEDTTGAAALEDIATLEAPHSPADQVAAAARQSRALEPADPACRGNDKPQCLTTVVLLADPDGRVGRVVVEPRASLAAVELTRPGDLGATSSRSVARGQLSASAVQQLQHRTQNLHDTQAAAATVAEVQLVVQAIEPLVESDAPRVVAPDAGQPVAPVAEAPALTPAPGLSPTPAVIAMLVVVDSIAVAPVTDEPTDTAPATPTERVNTAATPAVAPASPGAVALAAPIAVAPDSEKAPAVAVTPVAVPRTLATPGPVNDPAGAVATTTPADTVPVKLADAAAPGASVAPATPGSIAPTASGSAPPAALVTAEPGSGKRPSAGVTPAAAPIVTTLVATPAPSPVASPAAAPATSAPSTSVVLPTSAPVAPSPSPTPRVP